MTKRFPKTLIQCVHTGPISLWWILAYRVPILGYEGVKTLLARLDKLLDVEVCVKDLIYPFNMKGPRRGENEPTPRWEGQIYYDPFLLCVGCREKMQ